MHLPWTKVGEPDPNRDYVVMASRLPLARYRSEPSFLRALDEARRRLSTAVSSPLDKSGDSPTNSWA